MVVDHDGKESAWLGFGAGTAFGEHVGVVLIVREASGFATVSPPT